MKKLSFFKYAYLVFAILFFYDFISKLNEDITMSILSLLFCLFAIFIFFFRKKIQNRFNSRNK